jgi:UDP-2,3-diacylglucosamine pyrophosphatase LpxH
MACNKLTDSQLKKAYAAYVKAGNSYTVAAAGLGMSRSAFTERVRTAVFRGLAKPVPSKESSEIETSVRAIKEAKESQKALSDQLTATIKERDVALAQLGRARAGGKPDPIRVSPPKTTSRTGESVRVIIPDSHGAHIARNAAAAFLSDLKNLDPAEIIMLGDHLDCGGFLAQHHVMGFVAETETSYEEDVHSANEFLDKIQEMAPKASITYIEGNHESRIEKWCVTQALRNKRDSQFLLDAFGPVAVLRLAARGIKYIRSSGRYDDLPIPGTIRRGQCCFTHGISFGTHATHDHVRRFGFSVVHGHTHRAQSSIIRTVGGGLIGGWSPGCLSQLQPYYMATSPTDWSHGYGVQLVAKSGKFLHLNVPIMDGESMLLRGGAFLGR